MSKVLAPILYFIAAIGLFFSYISPAYDTLLAYIEREDRLDQAIQKAATLKTTYDQMVDRYRGFSRADMEKVNQLLPDTVDVVRLIIDFDSIAAANDLSITNFDIPEAQRVTSQGARSTRSAAEKDSPVLKAPFELTISGDYADLKAFMFSAEQSLTLLDVVQLQIVAGEPNARNRQLLENRYNITLQAYALK